MEFTISDYFLSIASSIGCCCQLPQYARVCIIWVSPPQRLCFAIECKGRKQRPAWWRRSAPNHASLDRRDLIFFLCWREPQRYSIIKKLLLKAKGTCSLSLCVWITRNRKRVSDQRKAFWLMVTVAITSLLLMHNQRQIWSFWSWRANPVITVRQVVPPLLSDWRFLQINC